MRAKKLKLVRSIERVKWNIPFYVLYGLYHQPSVIYPNRSLTGSFLHSKKERQWNLLWECAEYLANSTMTPENVMGMLYVGWRHFEGRDIHAVYFPKDEELWQNISAKYSFKGIECVKALLVGVDHRDWYQETHQAFVDQLPGYDIDLFIRAYAITSPQVAPHSNVRLALIAYECLTNGDSILEIDCIPPVKNMLGDLEVGCFNEEDISKRRKVVNFIKALDGIPHVVVVDSRTLRACGLGAWYELQGKIYLRCRKLEYDLIEHYFQSWATASAFEASQISAMVWVGMRRLNGKFKIATMAQVLSEVLHSLQKSYD